MQFYEVCRLEKKQSNIFQIFSISQPPPWLAKIFLSPCKLRFINYLPEKWDFYQKEKSFSAKAQLTKVPSNVSCLFFENFLNWFRTILKLLPKRRCTRLSCAKFLSRYINCLSFYKRISKNLDKIIAKIGKFRMGSTLRDGART